MASSRATTTPATTSDHLALPGAPTRVSFAKIREPLRVPDLLDLQTQSFEWLVGDEAWFQRRIDAGDESPVGGLEEILTEISPIEDFSGSMSLSFSDPRFDEVKASVEECKDKDMTYAAPLFVTAEFTNNTTGEIKSQTVFMGDFPVMTDKGTFIINGTERVVVSQLVRSPASTSTTTSTRPPRRTSTRSRSSPAAVRGWSSTSTSATPSASGSTASVASRSPCCSRPWAGRPSRSRPASGSPRR